MTALARALDRDRVSRRRPLAFRVVERNVIISRHYWKTYVARLFEPFLFLFSIGIGVGALVQGVTGPTGAEISYQSFVAPAMLATSAMNASVFTAGTEFFAKLKWVRSYESMLATPISVRDIVRGELIWILFTLSVQGVAFVATMAAMGLIESWWGLLLVPVSLLVGFTFASLGFVAASYLRSWLDFDYISIAIVPTFLFSASFFPLDRYPDGVAAIVSVTPLYHGVDLARDLAFGAVGWSSLISVAYLVVLGRLALAFAERRLAAVVQP